MNRHPLISLCVLTAFLAVPPTGVFAEASALDEIRGATHSSLGELAAVACATGTSMSQQDSFMSFDEDCLAMVFTAILGCAAAIANPLGPLTGPVVCGGMGYLVLSICTCFDGVGFLDWIFDAAHWAIECAVDLLITLKDSCDVFPSLDGWIDEECLTSSRGSDGLRRRTSGLVPSSRSNRLANEPRGSCEREVEKWSNATGQRRVRADGLHPHQTFVPAGCESSEAAL